MSDNVRICECCGKPFERKNNKQKYCSEECRLKKKHEKQKEYWKTHYKDRTRNYKYKPKKREGLTVEQINEEAMKVGMSYGKYVAMKGL